MKRERRGTRWGHISLGIVCIALVYQAGRARAGGTPTQDALVYSGILEEGGQPVSGTRSISLTLFDAESAGVALGPCSVNSQSTAVDAGHFSITLPQTCAQAVHDSDPEVWVEIAVDGATFPRTKIAAVPYALEATRATEAMAAAATGPLRTEIDALKMEVAALQAQLGADPLCPPGYAQVSDPTYVVCSKGADETVRVGQGSSAFWIDRHEASVWQNADGSGMVYFQNSDAEAPGGLPKSGSIAVSASPAFAVSKVGVKPSAYMTWFQAVAVCRASGKRLPTGEEWITATQGTNDPGSSNGSGGACNTNSGTVRNTGGGSACSSRWGAQDMIGNLWEWTAEWYADPEDHNDGLDDEAAPWPPNQGYGDGLDKTYNIVTNVFAYEDMNLMGIDKLGMPVAARRGGSRTGGTSAGAFSIALTDGPSGWGASTGFRCVIPR